MKNKKKEKIIVVLTGKEIASLQKVVRSGTAKAREITRARILLLAHRGNTNKEIAEKRWVAGSAPSRISVYDTAGANQSKPCSPISRVPDSRKR